MAPNPGDDDPFAEDPFSGDDDPDPRPEDNPLAGLFSQLGIPLTGDPVDFHALLERLQQMMGQVSPSQSPATPSGGVNWAYAKDTARKVVASLGPDPTPSGRQRREIADAVHLAELWLNDATSFGAVTTPPTAWSRAEWIESTMDAWQEMVEPIVSTIAGGLSDVMGDRMSSEPMLAGLQAMLQPMLQQSASSMFGIQLGQALGNLATQVVSGTDIGLPLTTRPVVALLPTNLTAFGDGLDLPERDIVLYFALREAARQRLFADVGWLGPQLVALVQHYAREIRIDPSALEETLNNVEVDEVSLESLGRLGEDVGRSLFDPAKTPEQLEILARLETLLALVEGWVDDVVTQSTAQRMPSATLLSETVRRRRASGGPAERTFASLVGLELRPRRVRDAANLWAAVRSAHGVEARDAVWDHPDTMPTSDDLSDPIGFVERPSVPQGDDMDAELRKLLDGEDPGSSPS